MKVICPKENLLEGINIVQKAVSTKTTLPILEGILLEAGDKFKLTGNDLEIGIECYIEEADIKSTGVIVLNSKILGDIVRRLPDSDVLLEVKENNLVVIECENSYFEIKGIAAEGFPEIPKLEKENGLRTSQKIIRDMIKQTIFAVSMDENRPILTGTLIECKGNELTFVAIDGFRLALRKNIIDGFSDSKNVVVPGKTLNEIAKILQSVDEEVTIYTTNNQVMFDMGNCRVVSRLLDGEYLNYNGILPKEHETQVRVNTKELMASLERASLVITSEERRFPVKINISDDKMVINSNTDLGSVREEIKVDMKGNNIDIAFNPKYFIDSLRAINEEEIAIFFTSNIGPCTIRPIEGNSFAYLVLPVRR